MENKFSFTGDIAFENDKMVVTVNVLDEGKVILSETKSVECDPDEITSVGKNNESESKALPVLKAGQSTVDNFGSGVWSILLKDVLKTVGSVLVAQIKKKLQEKLKDKFGTDNSDSE